MLEGIVSYCYLLLFYLYFTSVLVAFAHVYLNKFDRMITWLSHSCFISALYLQCESKKVPLLRPAVFWHFFTNSWEF